MLNSSDVQVLLVDLQDRAFRRRLTSPEPAIRASARALARFSKIYKFPVVQTLVPGGEEGQPRSIGEIADEVGADAFVRSSPHSLAYLPLRDALNRNGRRALGVGGLVSEIGLLNAVLGALDAGYQVHVLVDLAGGLTERTEQAAFRQMERAGAVLSSVPTFAYAMIDDFTTAAFAEAITELRKCGPMAAAR